jgi:hypothetical protein
MATQSEKLLVIFSRAFLLWVAGTMKFNEILNVWRRFFLIK